jgi:hypothetical protein
MDNIPVHLDSKLAYFISQINFKFTYNSCITIDIFDYFPLLKQGITYETIIKTMIETYTLFYANDHPEIIDEDKLFFETFNSDINLYFINDKYKLNRGGTLRNLIYLYRDLKFQPIEQYDDNLIKQLEFENLLSTELFQSIKLMKNYVSMSMSRNLPYNRLCELLISLNNKTLLQQLLLNKYVKLIYSILIKDKNTIYELLYINNIDPRLGNNELYKLSINKELDVYKMIDKINHNMFENIFKIENNIEISENTLEISDMIREISIKRNLLEKQMLTNNFEELIQIQSNLPDIIFSLINTFR